MYVLWLGYISVDFLSMTNPYAWCTLALPARMRTDYPYGTNVKDAPLAHDLQRTHANVPHVQGSESIGPIFISLVTPLITAFGTFANMDQANLIIRLLFLLLLPSAILASLPCTSDDDCAGLSCNSSYTCQAAFCNSLGICVRPICAATAGQCPVSTPLKPMRAV